MTIRSTIPALLASILLLPLSAISQPLQPVLLGTSGDFAILAKAAISTIPTSAITGDIGVSPAAQTFITGFSLTDNTGFATSTQVTGKVYAADQTPPTPSKMTTAISDMELAYTNGAGRVNPDFTELHTGMIGTKRLTPGLYKWTTTVSASSGFELAGSATDIWIFQISGDLAIANNVNMLLSGGAQAGNVFWIVAGAVTIGTGSHMEGNILTATAIDMGTGASLLGRALAQTAVNLSMNTVVKPTLNTTGIETEQTPATVALSQNYPNPFNPTTVIRFTLDAGSHTTLAVYDLLGREVAVLVNGMVGSGSHRVTFDASGLTTGLYLYRLTSGGTTLYRSMSLVK